MKSHSDCRTTLPLAFNRTLLEIILFPKLAMGFFEPANYVTRTKQLVCNWLLDTVYERWQLFLWSSHVVKRSLYFCRHCSAVLGRQHLSALQIFQCRGFGYSVQLRVHFMSEAVTHTNGSTERLSLYIVAADSVDCRSNSALVCSRDGRCLAM